MGKKHTEKESDSDSKSGESSEPDYGKKVPKIDPE